MSKEPLISFVIPVYKKPPEIFEKCLASLFDSSLKEIEVIAVFDGEDKELEAIARRFKDVLCFTIERGGAPKARNYGTSVAKGKYVACWDADCYAKPGMAKRWIEEFEATGADFVYSGYEFTGERGGFESEEFDAYSLQCGNYISSMAPILRSKAPKWDETLKGAQDWDYWLSAVDSGCKGSFIPGAGFITEPSHEGSISFDAWSIENREETISLVKEKHGIPIRDIGVYSMNYGKRALKLAKILGADVIKGSGKNPSKYRMLFNFGYGHLSRFEGIGDEVIKVQYWIPGEIEGLADAKYNVVKETVRVSQKVINFCNTIYEKNKLSDLGIDAEIAPLPLAEEDIKNVQTSLPDEFSALVIVDENYGKLLKEIQQDLPHIKFGFNQGNTKDYSCLISFYTFAALDEPIEIAHVNGRNVISNVQAPFCGFVDPSVTWEEFKGELYQKIREARGKGFNKDAQGYYLQLVDPSKFRDRVFSYLPKPELMVLV